ncbi:TPA: hypothetical protein DCW38_05405 [candidate division WOR-3 bacterium]|jgi:hypothetical protein|uniref:Uncharacterized protein n=1 Tax=candidate division WOR-3 bacterium TaxID=2052148 RepID=A0A350HAN4_UNCW3|nr:hypothetical protein [candidate division WOR-3 bacterium]
MPDNFVPVTASEISSDRKKEIISKIAKNIVLRGLTAPAIMFLESVKPMNFLGSQVMVFFEPIILTFFNISEYREASLMFEERDTIEKLINEIENQENEIKKDKKKSVKEDK